VDLRDYVQMLRRGWPTVLLLTALFLGLAAGYLALAPKRYQATAVLFVSLPKPESVTDRQLGLQFSSQAAITYAELVNSAIVLAPVAKSTGLDLDDLRVMVSAVRRPDTALVDIVATGRRPSQVAAVANATAVSAASVIPDLESKSSGTSEVRLQRVERAVVPTTALSPDVKRTVTLGGIIGLSVGLAVTIARQALDTRLRRAEDLRRLTEVPVLAVLPRLKRSERRGVVVRDDPTGVAGEAYRSLRTNLSYLEFEERRSLMFTSVADGRDGALVPVNLAWSIAQAGRRVLLVDLDLRQSSVGATLNLRPDLGLADALASEVDIMDTIRNTDHDKLQVVLSGTSQPSPSDLLSSPTMTTVLHRLEQEYEYVILHAPPVLAYTDAAVVSHVAGWTLVTVAAGQARAQDLSTALEALANVRVTPLGLVLSGARGSDQMDQRKVRGRWVGLGLPSRSPRPVSQPARSSARLSATRRSGAARRSRHGDVSLGEADGDQSPSHR
jgi:succinoglycan biosynthesis transport protein ExoP